MKMWNYFFFPLLLWDIMGLYNLWLVRRKINRFCRVLPNFCSEFIIETAKFVNFFAAHNDSLIVLFFVCVLYTRAKNINALKLFRNDFYFIFFFFQRVDTLTLGRVCALYMSLMPIEFTCVIILLVTYHSHQKQNLADKEQPHIVREIRPLRGLFFFIFRVAAVSSFVCVCVSVQNAYSYNIRLLKMPLDWIMRMFSFKRNV